MLGDISGMGNVYVITGRTDMRKSFDSLILLIQDTYQLDPYSKSVFLFCGRDTSKLKALYHDRLSADFCYPHILSSYDTGRWIS
ncbi:MAG: IS66 family insertion sequence element accessory protein TnpB [Lachnospiraceae bacterium]